MRRALHIEDSDTDARLLELALEGTSWEVERASTLAGGLTAARFRPPDVILLDLSLPDAPADPVELYQEVTRAVTCPVIAVTANRMPGTPRRLAEAGCSSFIQKSLLRPGTDHDPEQELDFAVGRHTFNRQEQAEVLRTTTAALQACRTALAAQGA